MAITSGNPVLRRAGFDQVLAGAETMTLGGTLACNMAGPRRIKAGAARDHFLGFTGVNGFGEIFKAGGKVVKNVTGYDLCKLMAGSYGTLAILGEVTVKTVPRPDDSCSLLVLGLDDAAAILAMSEALNAPHEVSAAAHLPAAIAKRINEDVNKVLAMPDVIEKFDGFGVEDGGGSVEKFAKFQHAEIAKWAKVVKDAKVTIDG